MAVALSSTFDKVFEAEWCNPTEITILSFEFYHRIAYMVVKDKDDTVFNQIKQFQQIGLKVTFIYLYDSPQHILAQKQNILISKNEFDNPVSRRKFLKMFFNSDTKRIPPSPCNRTHTKNRRRGAKKISRTVSALIDQTDKQLAACRVHYCHYPRNLLELSDVLPFLPDTPYVIFTAFGSYQKSYHFSTILKTFQTFAEDYQKIHPKTMVLVLGGEYDHERDYKHLCDIRKNCKQSPNSIVYFKQQLSISEKTIILKNSTGLFDYKQGVYNCGNIRLGFKVGVPVLSGPYSYSRKYMIPESFGYYIHIINYHKKSGEMMDNIIINGKWMSTLIKIYHANFMSHMYMVLQEFEEEDRLFLAPGSE